MFHYTYEIVYESGLRYIGSRTSKKEPEKDIHYWGSSKYTPKNDMKKTKIILSTFNTRKEAYAHEIYLHKYNDVIKNPKYCNKAMQTSEGFSTAGTKQNPERIEMRASIHRGKSLSSEHRQKISNSKIGKKRPQSFIDRLREVNTGKKKSEKSIQKQKDTFVKNNLLVIDGDGNYHISEEQKLKLSIALSGRIITQEHKDKISKANTGKKRTSEQKQKMSENKKGVGLGRKASDETKRKQSISAMGKHMKYPGKYHWINSETKEKKYATCHEMADLFCPGYSGNFSAMLRNNKKYKTYHKWELNNEE